MSHYNI